MRVNPIEWIIPNKGTEINSTHKSYRVFGGEATEGGAVVAVVEVVEAGFGVEVLALEAERGFGGAGLGDEVAEGVEGSAIGYNLALVGEGFVNGADLIFDVGVPAAVVCGKGVGSGFRVLEMAFYVIHADAVHIAANGLMVFVEFQGDVVFIP